MKKFTRTSLLVILALPLLLIPGQVGANDDIDASIHIDPDTLNLKSNGEWITCYIELPEGYDVADIDVSSILLNDTVPAEAKPTEIGDYDEDGIPDLIVKFDRDSVQEILDVGDDVEVIVTGVCSGTQDMIGDESRLWQ